MRRAWRSSKKKEREARENAQRDVEKHESDEELEDERGRGPDRPSSLKEGHSSLPEDWALKRPGSRRSMGKRSQASRSDVSPSRSETSKASNAEYDDVYEQEQVIEVVLNPDVEHQIDAEDEDFEKFNLPRPGTKETSKNKKKGKKKGARGSRRLGNGINKLVGEGVGKPVQPPTGKLSEKERKKTSLQQRLLRSSKRLSFKKNGEGPKPPSLKDQQKEAARQAKLRAKQEKEEEKRRQREIKNNPWYPAGVDFRYLNPKSKWLPYLGRSKKNLDFGDEARLVGVVG